MLRRPWSREELLLAMNLYCQLPFGKLHRSQPDVIRLANAIERTPSSVAMKLCNLASLDPAQQQRGIKGLAGASRADRQIWAEFHHDWNALAVESEELCIQYGLITPPGESAILEDAVDTKTDLSNVTPAAGTSTKTSTIRPAFDPLNPTESTRLTKVRLAQGFFRKAVLTSYHDHCAISGIDHPSLLVASHIIPWSHRPEHRTNPRNGICLSTLHDAAFDRGLITFDADLRLILSSQIVRMRDNRVMREAFHDCVGQSLNRPERFCPDPEFVAYHRAEIFQG